MGRTVLLLALWAGHSPEYSDVRWRANLSRALWRWNAKRLPALKEIESDLRVHIAQVPIRCAVSLIVDQDIVGDGTSRARQCSHPLRGFVDCRLVENLYREHRGDRGFHPLGGFVDVDIEKTTEKAKQIAVSIRWAVSLVVDFRGMRLTRSTSSVSIRWAVSLVVDGGRHAVPDGEQLSFHPLGGFVGCRPGPTEGLRSESRMFPSAGRFRWLSTCFSATKSFGQMGTFHPLGGFVGRRLADRSVKDALAHLFPSAGRFLWLSTNQDQEGAC